MFGWMKDIWAAIKIQVFESKIYRSISIGFALSAFISLIIGVFSGTFVIDKEKFVKIENQHSTFDSGTIIIIFLILGFTISILGYITTIRESEDSYSWLRKRLIGTWNFQLDSWRLEDGANWIKQPMIYTVVLSLNPDDSKLSAQVNQFGHDFFDDCMARTDMVHLSGGGSSFSLVALTRIDQTIRAGLASRFDDTSFEMKILVELDVDVTDKNNIISMKGVWYDIDNVMWRVIEQYQAEDKVEELWNYFKDGVYNFQGDVKAAKISPKS